MALDDKKLIALEQQVEKWLSLPFSPEIEKGCKELVEQIPETTPEMKAADKCRLHLLKGQAALVTCTTKNIAKVEEELNKALRLNKKSARTWLALSECYLRRAAYNEARDAAEQCLSLDPSNVQALLKTSQAVRLNVTNTKQEPGKQTKRDPKADEAALSESIAKAKEAIKLEPENQECWMIFGLALLTQTSAAGLTAADSKKVHFAFSQAIAKAEAAGETVNPDALTNRAHMSRVNGDVQASLKDLERAVEIDPHGLGHAKLEADAIRKTLQRLGKIIDQKYGGLNERDFKKNFASKIPTDGYAAMTIEEMLAGVAKGTAGTNPRNKAVVRVKVINNITAHKTSQPQMYHCIDKNGGQLIALLSLYEADAIKAGDVLGIAVPPCILKTNTVTISRAKEAGSGAAAGDVASTSSTTTAGGETVTGVEEEVEVVIPFVTLDAAGFLIGSDNPVAVKDSKRAQPSLSTQLLF